ncbi:unnamed protein product [Boreogadus saida]
MGEAQEVHIEDGHKCSRGVNVRTFWRVLVVEAKRIQECFAGNHRAAGESGASATIAPPQPQQRKRQMAYTSEGRLGRSAQIYSSAVPHP